jgi:HD-like signal output (HDOD) protein
MAVANPSRAGTPSPAPVDLLRSIVGGVNQLPTLPETATRALEIANAPDSSLRDFTSIIERDPPIAAGILRLANSANNRIGSHLESINQAVVRLGLRQCKNLVISVGMRSLLNSIPATRKAQCEILWNHSFVTACLARRLNRSLEFGYQGEEFACGLSHDIGRILFAIGVPDHFEEADPMTFDEDNDAVLAHEGQRLGTDHCTFGAWFCDNNKLPPSVGTVVRYHHHPGRAASHHNLIGLVAAADHAANYLQRTGTTDGYNLAANPGWQFLARNNLDTGLRDKVQSLFPPMMGEAYRESQEAENLN